MMKSIALSILILVMLSITMEAQTIVNKGRLIYVKGTDLSVKGDFQNMGTVQNSGIISISGNWTNNNKYLASTGTFVLNGDLAQQVLHNKDSFHILILKGIGEKFLQDEAQIVKDVQFSSSILTTQGTGAMIALNGSQILGASATGYVNGLLVREGLGSREYPIGKGGKYLPVTLTSITGTNDVMVGLEIKEPNTGAQPGATLKAISQLRYAELTTRKGIFNGSPITLTIGVDEDQSSPLDLVVTESITQNGQYRNLGQSNLTATSITSSFLVTGTFFAIGVGDLLDQNAIYVPNALSPSAPNLEDQTIKIYGDLLVPEDFEFKVFSKWGNIIFESNSLTEMKSTGWRGINRETGETLSLGVYTFATKGKFINGKNFEKTGTITMIR